MSECWSTSSVDSTKTCGPRQCYGSRRLSRPAYWPANTAARPGSSSTKKTASSQSSVADRPQWVRLRLVLRRLRNKVSEAAKGLLRNPQRLVSARDIGVTSVPVPIIGLADDQARDKRDLYHVCGDAPAIWRVRLMSLAAEI